jgi:hypothetical protein
MAVYRLVSKSDASTPEAAVEFIRQDTGGAVLYDTTWPIIEEEDHFRVPCFSFDGRSAMPLSVVRSLAVLGKDENGNELKEREEFESVGPNPTDDRVSEMRRNAAELHKLLRS